MSFVPNIARLETERLVLRAPVVADFAHWAAYFASERSRYEGGPFGVVDPEAEGQDPGDVVIVYDLRRAAHV